MLLCICYHNKSFEIFSYQTNFVILHEGLRKELCIYARTLLLRITIKMNFFSEAFRDKYKSHLFGLGLVHTCSPVSVICLWLSQNLNEDLELRTHDLRTIRSYKHRLLHAARLNRC